MLPRHRQFPNLSVRNTLDFAFAQKTPSPEVRRPVSHDDDKPLGEKDFNAQAKARLLKVFGLEHTEDTPVGDEYVRGVSGGEKKRVSITEVLANRASIQAWDNATRGLDANTALSFTKALRTYADLERLTAVVSLYQAGNGIYDQFDKVLVLAEGQVIFYGRRTAAKTYFEEMGFDAVEGANVADYLTGTTVPKERQVRDGFEGKIPETIDDFARRYRESEVAKEMRKELDDHLANMDEVERHTTEAQEAIQAEKHKGAIMREPHVRGIWAQTMIALRREVQQRWGDKWFVRAPLFLQPEPDSDAALPLALLNRTFWARQVTTFIMAFVVGSVFYNLQNETNDIVRPPFLATPAEWANDPSNSAACSSSEPAPSSCRCSSPPWELYLKRQPVSKAGPSLPSTKASRSTDRPRSSLRRRSPISRHFSSRSRSSASSSSSS